MAPLRICEAAGSGCHDTRDKHGAKRLDQRIVAEAGQPAADERTSSDAGRHQQQARRIERT
jgi:hypothetical protein